MLLAQIVPLHHLPADAILRHAGTTRVSHRIRSTCNELASCASDRLEVDDVGR